MILLDYFDRGVYRLGAILKDLGEKVDKRLIRQAWRNTADARRRIMAIDRSVGKANAPMRASKVKAAITEAVQGIEEKVSMTPSKLLGYAMKKAQTVSRQAYMAGAKDMVASHVDLMQEAKDKLSSADVGRVAEAIAKARTPAAQRRVAMAIQILADHRERQAAIGDFVKTVKRIDIKHLRPNQQKRVKALLDSINPTNTAALTMRKLEGIVRAGKIDAAGENPILQDLARRAKGRLERIGATPLQKLPVESIRAITEYLKAAARESARINMLLVGRKLRQLDEAGKQAAQDITASSRQNVEPSAETREGPKQRGRIRTFISHQDKPNTAALRMSAGNESGVIYEVWYQGIADGRSRQIELNQRAEDLMVSALSEQGVGLAELKAMSAFLSGKNAKKLASAVTLANGRTIRITPAERMLLLASMSDPKTRRLIIRSSRRGGGISLADALTGKPIALSQADMSAIADSATAEEKAIVQAAKDYINGPLRDDLNKAWVEQYGFEIARNTDYFPRVINALLHQGDVPGGLQYVHDIVYKDFGIFKERTKHAKPVIVGDFFQVFLGHVSKVNAFVSLAEPLRNARLLMKNPDVVAALDRTGNRDVLAYFKKYFSDVEGLQRTDVSEPTKWWQWIRAKQYIANLGLNVKVALKQPVSYVLASETLGYKYMLLGAKGNPWSSAIIGEINEHSPPLRARFEGSHAGLAGPTNDPGQALRFYTGKTPGIGNKLISPIHKGDQAAIVGIWRGAKLRVEAESSGVERGSAEYWAKVRSLAEQAVAETQPVFDASLQAELQRSAKAEFVPGVLTLYSSQRNQNWNMLRRANIRYQNSAKSHGDKVKLFNSYALVLVTNAVAMMAMDEFWGWVYRGFRERDEKKGILGYAFDYLRLVAGNLFGGTEAANMTERAVRAAAGKRQPFQRENPAAELIEDASLAVGEGVGMAVEAIRDPDAVMKSGPNKGEARWAVKGERAAEAAFMTASVVFGLPRWPYYVGRGAYRAATEPETTQRGTAAPPTIKKTKY